MAAILEPRPFHHTGHRPHGGHLAVVPLDGPVTVVDPVEQVLEARTAVAMVAAVLVALVLALGIGGGAFSALVPEPASSSAPSAGPAATVGGTVVTVERGDSVWSIARSLQPEGDVRPLVDRIVAANGSSVVQPGQQIAVPG